MLLLELERGFVLTRRSLLKDSSKGLSRQKGGSSFWLDRWLVQERVGVCRYHSIVCFEFKRLVLVCLGHGRHVSFRNYCPRKKNGMCLSNYYLLPCYPLAWIVFSLIVVCLNKGLCAGQMSSCMQLLQKNGKKRRKPKSKLALSGDRTLNLYSWLSLFNLDPNNRKLSEIESKSNHKLQLTVGRVQVKVFLYPKRSLQPNPYPCCKVQSQTGVGYGPEYPSKRCWHPS